MTRTLTAAVTTQKNAHANRPVYFAKIELGGAVGTKWLSDQPFGSADGSSYTNAEARINTWGTVSIKQVEDNRYNPIGDMQIAIDDKDAVWHGYYQSVEFQRKNVTIYQWFSGLDEADLTIIYKGIINDTPEWDDDGRLMTLRLTDYSTKYSRPVGTLADKNRFSGVDPSDEDSIFPIVGGSVRRSPCVAVDVGSMCHIIRAISWDTTKIYVDDAERFPQKTAIQIRINNEIISGSFDGNTFTATQRCADLVTDSVVDASVDEISFDDLDLSPNDATYTGYYVKINDPDVNNGFDAYRRIIGYDGTLRRIYMTFPPFVKSGAYWTIPPGTIYSISSRGIWAGYAHGEGSKVFLVQDEYVYIAADHPCKSVKMVEGFGNVKHATNDADALEWQQTETYIRLDPGWYTVNTNDDRYASILGHNVTTISFSKLPQELKDELTSNKLWADIEGIESAGDGSGTILENPADIIKEFLTRSQFGNVDAADYDSASFTAAASVTSYLRMGFSINSQMLGSLQTEQRLPEIMHLIADLAWQCRCALNWNDGKAYLEVLYNRSLGNDATLDSDSFEVASVRKKYTAMDDVASEIVATYFERGEKKSVVVKDSSVETALGRHARERDLWAYSKESEAINVASWWLTRMKYIYEIVRLRCFLNALELQRNDSITIDYPTLFATNQVGTILEVDHTIRGGETGGPHVIDIAIRLPRFAGCESACEVGCETGGCETGCEWACEGGTESCWKCETACEVMCELICVTQAELYCGVSDTGCSETNPCGACETSCTTSCELDTCESGCETSCETSCEVACQSACESACETGCEVSCETGCETSCESGCEVGCESGCEIICESTCESGCQTGCELDCESAGCEGSCESGCELDCESSGCEGACETDCQTGGCEVGGCEGSCQSNCELACESAGCEGACETDCELSCEASGCEGTCETTCQTQCEQTCQTGGCETSCETGGCETSCETSCESECETDCETGCETGGESCDFSDDFNRTNEDPLAGDWDSVGGWEVISNMAEQGDQTQGTYAHRDLGAGCTDHYAECNLYASAGVTFRRSDASNYYRYYFTAANLLQLHQFVGGTPTFIDDYSGLSNASHLRGVTSGNDISVQRWKTFPTPGWESVIAYENSEVPSGTGVGLFGFDGGKVDTFIAGSV